MKLGTLIHPTKKDGELIVVSKNNLEAVKVGNIASSLREAFDIGWDVVCPQLEEIYTRLNDGGVDQSFKIDETKLHSPMPRCFQWADGSAYIHHIKLVRKSRNAALPETLNTVPLMYQGGSDSFLAPNQDIPQIDFSHGTDFEGEVGVILDDVPMGVSPEKALEHIKLLVIINDVSLRGLIPEELKNGFGFFHGKPSSAFAPFAVTFDELGEAWQDGRIQLPLLVDYKGEFFGKANAKEMHFHFGQLIAHAAKTRALGAGTIIGSGTVSNENPEMGSSCLLEKRMIEKIKTGEFVTPFMSDGDTIEIKMEGIQGQNIFGTISQTVRSV